MEPYVVVVVALLVVFVVDRAREPLPGLLDVAAALLAAAELARRVLGKGESGPPDDAP